MSEIFTHAVPSFIFVLGIIIFVHEFGHLIVAKAFGMRVFIFSFGFGKRLFGFQWGDTDCRVSLIPLGGYVKLEGEPEDHLSEDTSARAVGDGKDFLSRPRWQRFLVYLAGPAMNAVLTISVLTVFHMVSFAVDASRYDRPIVGAMDADSPAAAAGLRIGDVIEAVEDSPVANWEEAQYQVLLRPDREFELRVRRDGRVEKLKVRAAASGPGKMGDIGVHPLVRVGSVLPGEPAAESGLRADDAILKIGETSIKSFGDIPPLVQGSKGQPLQLTLWREGETVSLALTPREKDGAFRVGIAPKMVVKKFGPLGAVREATVMSWNMTKQTFDVLKGLVTARISPKTMMGPLGIAKASGERAREGWSALFYLIAVISLQVGILNLVPLAPLDGGHMAILAGEGFIRRDFSMAVKTWIMNAGALVIFLLIGLVLYSDLSKTSLLGKYLP
jgi:regulator of sigma E protease